MKYGWVGGRKGEVAKEHFSYFFFSLPCATFLATETLHFLWVQRSKRTIRSSCVAIVPTDSSCMIALAVWMAASA